MQELIEKYHKLSEEKQKLVKVLLKEQGIDINSKIILPRKRNQDNYLMSYAQQRLWFLEQLEPESPLYIIPSGVKIKGKVKLDLMLKAINLIVKRHEILRTKFINISGEGFQEVLPELNIDAIKYDLSNIGKDSEEELQNIIQKESTKPFNLSECPLFRVITIKILDDLNYLLMPMHHIVSDNWSTGVLIGEILLNYKSLITNKEVEVDPLKIQYLDYASWQKEWLSGDELTKQKEYWVNQLTNSNEILEIIPDKQRPAIQSSKGAFELFVIEEQVFNRLERFCKKEEITIFVLLISTFQLLLSKYANQNDINIGVPIANRNRAEVEELIGFFINTLVFRGNVKNTQTVSEFLSETKKISFEAFSNQDIPFEMIVDELKLERDMSRTALFQAMFVLNNAPATNMEIEGLEIEPLNTDTGTTKFDLVLSTTQNKNELLGKFEYSTDLHKAETIQGMIENYKFLLNQFVEFSENKLKEINFVKQNKVLEKLNIAKYASKEFDKDDLIHLCYEKVAKENGNKIAISDGTKSLTYSELDDLSNSIANSIIDNNIMQEQTVGIFLDRRIEYIAALLGIFKAGAVFVPLDIDFPEDRLKYIIDDAKINCVISSSEINTNELQSIKSIITIENVSEAKNSLSIDIPKVLPENIAYIIYTSGTTGLPKGVMVEHSKIANHIKQMIVDFQIDDTDKYLEFASFNFDASLEQIFVPLLAGAEIFLRGNDYWILSDFIDLITRENITVINPPTIYWNQLVAELKNRDDVNLGKLKLVIVGGEEMKSEMLLIWNEKVSPNIQLINAYGPTETIITPTMYKLNKNIDKQNKLHIPIGKCLGSREVYIVDSLGKLVPTNVPGELCFGSDLIARGYLNNPSLTAEKFIPNKFTKFNGDRIYKTGDLARYDNSGSIEYLGRVDNQVKVRGFRIELSEIEQVLLKNKNVKQAVVMVHTNGKDDSNIIAHLVLAEKQDNIEENLKLYLTKNLPKYMMPNHINILSELPLNANGKLDKKELHETINFENEVKQEFVEARTDLEKTIVDIVAEILSVEKVGIYDNFFELGGHSILAIKAITKVRETFGVEVQLKNLFENPTIIGISEAVITEQAILVEDDELEKLLNELELDN
ncbi:MAG: amino acid adenylation domain-containing protein [Ignavibacteriae bacterium]|nr:amino acid adenylation domain-containing protein [Ignavibacteriota bacterium]